MSKKSHGKHWRRHARADALFRFALRVYEQDVGRPIDLGDYLIHAILWDLDRRLYESLRGGCLGERLGIQPDAEGSYLGFLRALARREPVALAHAAAVYTAPAEEGGA